MNLKRFGLALAAVAMLAAIVTGSASAAATTPAESHWTIAGVKMAAGTSETVSCSVGKHLFAETGLREAKLELNGSLGAAKTPVKLTATGIECLNLAGTEAGKATINQTATMAEDEGRLRFTGVTVDSPPNCQVQGISIADPVGTVTTNKLVSRLEEETVGGVTTVFDRFAPKEGEVFVEIKVSKKAELACAVSGNYSAKGLAYGEAVKNVEATEPAPTGFDAVTQALTFSPGIDTTAGSTLTLGGNPASITGRVLNKLSGPNINKEWGAVQ